MLARLKTWSSALGLCAIVALMIGVVVRTEAVAGDWLDDRLASWASERGWEVQIGGMSPDGLTGLRLEDVRIRARHRSVDVVAIVDRVSLFPNVRRLFSGDVTADRVVLEDGDVTLMPAAGKGSTDVGSGSEVTHRHRSSGDREDQVAGSNEWVEVVAPDRLSVTAKRLDVRGGLDRRLLSRRWTIESLTVTSPSVDRWSRQFRLSGYGATARGTPFTLETGSDEEASVPRVEVQPLSRIRGTDLFADARVSNLRVDGVSVCPGCQTDALCARDVEWRGDRMTGQLRRACVGPTTSGLEARFSPADLSPANSNRAIQFRDTVFKVSASDRTAEATTHVTDGAGGTARLTLIVRPDASRPVIGKFHSDGYDAELPLKWSGLKEHITRGEIAGDLFAGWSPAGNRLRVKANGHLRDAEFNHPLLGSHPVPVDQLRAAWISQIQLDQGVVNIPQMQMRLADSVPIEVSGYLADARPGWSFAARIRASGVSAPRLHRRLPDILAKPATGTRLTGTFDSRIRIAGHTEKPERLSLQVDIGGGVDVDPVDPEFDLPTLAAAGPPVADAGVRRATDIPLDQWVSLDAMPELISRAITAAEDVHFFDHDGFAWGGLRNAMVHNLQVGRLERGGSTITQQVAKNLFLTHRRTLTRKAHEMWLTWRLESRLSKQRILELYLNIVEWGPDSVRGLREAARHFFDVAPDKLSTGQVTLLASILPAPAFYGQLIDNGYLPSSRLEKIQHILQNLAYLDVISTREYNRLWDLAQAGHPGGLDLTLCRDPNPPRREVPPETPECAGVLES